MKPMSASQFAYIKKLVERCEDRGIELPVEIDVNDTGRGWAEASKLIDSLRLELGIGDSTVCRRH